MTLWERSLVHPITIQCVRLQLGIISAHMLAIALWVVHLASAHNHSSAQSTHPVLLNAVLAVWIVALVYGGVSGLVAVARDGLMPALHTLASWLVVSVLHAWYLFVGRHTVMKSASVPYDDFWNALAQLLVDALCTALVAGFVLVLSSHRKYVDHVHHDSELQTLMPSQGTAPSNAILIV